MLKSNNETETDRRYHCVTHPHTDHLAGLRNSTAVFPHTIICSSETKCVLLHHAPKRLRKSQFIVLAPGQSLRVSDDLTIHAFRAHHCVGSLMFVFVGRVCGRVLYTGDCRVTWKDADKVSRAVGPVDRVYYDGTFGENPAYIGFPSQMCTLNRVLKFARELPETTKLQLAVDVVSTLPIIVRVARLMQCKAVVSCAQYDKVCFPEAKKWLVNAASGREASRLTVVCQSTREPLPPNTVRLKLSALQFLKRKPWPKWTSLQRDRENESYRLFFAAHSDYMELQSFLTHLRKASGCVLTNLSKPVYDAVIRNQKDDNKLLQPERLVWHYDNVTLEHHPAVIAAKKKRRVTNRHELLSRKDMLRIIATHLLQQQQETNV